ncbi:MAG TPA: beta-ketoacyl synthase N-terminal-like domain-containing protein [Anaeromyxobacteraceae bacterium]|nr:beta-ketoacyl synthase N-terminal-like domain-containing protein [Anaeromyxobacteraceae bacterium]
MNTTVPIAVTGASVLTALGNSIDALQAALRAGRTSVPRVSNVDAVETRIAGFDATQFVNVRGLRLYNRPTQLAICAAKLALTESGCEGQITGEHLGVVAACTYAHLETLFEYDRSLVVNGLMRTNPTLMPIGIPSSLGAAVALSFGAKALSVTLGDGGASSLDAIGLAARLLAAGRARACLVVSAFTPCQELLLSASRAGLLAPPGDLFVFDRAHCGTAFCEAACALLLERAEDAIARGARLQATLGGQCSTFAAERSEQARALSRAGEVALRLAGIGAGELALVSASASGSPSDDRSEAEALVAVLGRAPVPMMAVKGNLGDSQDAAGLLQTIAAIAALRAGTAAPIRGLVAPEVPGLRYATEELSIRGPHALVTSQASTGACSALVVTGAA